MVLDMERLDNERRRGCRDALSTKAALIALINIQQFLPLFLSTVLLELRDL